MYVSVIDAVLFYILIFSNTRCCLEPGALNYLAAHIYIFML